MLAEVIGRVRAADAAREPDQADLLQPGGSHHLLADVAAHQLQGESQRHTRGNPSCSYYF
jgi:hypothetical protein